MAGSCSLSTGSEKVMEEMEEELSKHLIYHREGSQRLLAVKPLKVTYIGRTKNIQCFLALMIPLCVDQISFCCLCRNSRPESGRWNEVINVKKYLRFSDLAVFLSKVWWRRPHCFISTHALRSWVSKHFPWRLDHWEHFITSVMDTGACAHIYCLKPLRVISQSPSPLSFTSFLIFSLKLFFSVDCDNEKQDPLVLYCFTNTGSIHCVRFQRPFRKEMKTRWELVMKTEAVSISRNAFLPLFY